MFDLKNIIKGMSLCKFMLIKQKDDNFENIESVEACLKALRDIRTFMQTIISKESLSWILYNATILIYRISYGLMSVGHSLKVFYFIFTVYILS